ncbi:MAG TPA: PAS domain S-box protein [Candidatus Dormibacteraeota bacterium]|nr:PAS domain S-box protein [Candidatus Dormibacteraeota bacterium]
MTRTKPSARELTPEPVLLAPLIEQSGPVFQSLFERSADAIWLLDPETSVFLDCNQAAVDLIGAESKEQLLQTTPEDLGPPFQPDGVPTRQKSDEILALVKKHKTHRFEWMARRLDGRDVPLEVSATAIQVAGRPIHVVMSRDISERRQAEADLRESEAKFRQVFEASTDAISIFDPATRKNIACNEATVKLVGGKDKAWFLNQLPEALSPKRQPDGRLSNEAGAAWVQRALSHGPQRFEWTARRSNGEEFPVEILLAPLQIGERLLLVTVSRDISDRKKAEQALLDLNQSLERRVAERTAALTTSEARFRALVENAPEAIVVYSADTGHFLFGNQHACDLYGIPMSKLSELTPMDVSPEFQPGGRRTSDLAREKTAEVLSGGMAIFDWVHKKPNGRLIPTEVRLLRLPAEGQNLIRASIIDNTERKRSERALRDSESKFRALFEGSSQGVLLQDEHQLLEVNPASVRIMRRKSVNEMLGKHPGEMAPPFQPDGESSVLAAHRHVQECMTKGTARFEWVAAAPDGEEIPLEIALTRIEWSGRQVIQAFITDITERKRAQSALAESEARFNLAFQASPVFISILRMSDGAYVLANDAFINWVGYPEDEIMGRTSVEFGMWESAEERDAALHDMRTIGSIRQREVRWCSRGGERLFVLLSAETITLDKVPHILSFAQDITQRKRAEVELLKTLEREKELSQLKSNFVSMVSHEFRTPLGIIQSSGELLRDFYARMEPLEREEQLDSIIRNTRRMAGMMEAILVLSRMDAGKLEFRPTSVNLEPFCRRMVDEVLSATNHRCGIELSVVAGLPPAKVDERLVGHMVTNLLSNAIKYSEPGSTVKFSVGREQKSLVCSVRDHGIGISEEDQQRLFTAFHRGANVGNRPGTGLGLVLVKRCVEMHGGQMKIQSALGRGTTVTLKLPSFGRNL